MIITLPLTTDSYNTYCDDLSISIKESYHKGSVTIIFEDREISVDCLQLRKALRALQSWNEGDE